MGPQLRNLGVLLAKTSVELAKENVSSIEFLGKGAGRGTLVSITTLSVAYSVFSFQLGVVLEQKKAVLY